MSNALENTTPRRIPKLAVRNRIPDEEAEEFARKLGSRDGEYAASQAASSRSSERASTIPDGWDRRPSDLSLRVRRTSTQQPKDVPPTRQGDGKVLQAKKKKSGVFGFLTLKEPSTSAWEEFAETQKKAAAAKKRESGGKATTTSALGVSSQKLPNHVPKVNSKWDGLPETAKRKMEAQRERERANRSSVFSAVSTRQSVRSGGSSFSDSTQSPRRTYGSLSSRPQSLGILASRSQRLSTQSGSSSQPSRDSNLPQPTPPNAIHPALREHPVQELPSRHSETFLHPPSPPPIQRQPGSPDDVPEELPALEDYEALSHVLYTTSPEKSPLTPLTPPPFEIPKPPSEDTLGVTAATSIAGEYITNGTFWNSDTETEDMPIKKSAVSVPRSSYVLTWQQSEAAIPEDDEPSPPPSRDEQMSDWPLRTKKVMPRPTPLERAALHSYQPSTASVPSRMDSTTSRFSTATGTTATTMLSPTFSTNTMLTEDDTSRPSTAASTTTAHQMYDLSPIRSNSDGSICAPSIAPSTAPSELSVRWTMSPTERLGLGAKVRKGNADVLPWEMDEPPNALRNSTHSSASADKKPANAKKRLSMFERK